jgi:hypothetical protein
MQWSRSFFMRNWPTASLLSRRPTLIRTCSKCGTDKPESEFYSVTQRGITRLRRICKDCIRAQNRDHSNDLQPEGRICTQCGVYQTERKTSDFSPGDTSESLFCGIFVLYRRAYGNSRLWSGGDNQAANERVRRSQQIPVCLVRGVRPRNPPASAVGRVKNPSRSFISTN